MPFLNAMQRSSHLPKLSNYTDIAVDAFMDGQYRQTHKGESYWLKDRNAFFDVYLTVGTINGDRAYGIVENGTDLWAYCVITTDDDLSPHLCREWYVWEFRLFPFGFGWYLDEYFDIDICD